jgi:transposase-like protein
MSDSRRRAVWDWPDCPECDSEIFVEYSPSPFTDFICHDCGEDWEAEE